MLLTLQKVNFRYIVCVSLLNTSMRAKEFITERWNKKARKRSDKRLMDITSKEAWRLAHDDDEKEFHNLVLKFYDEYRKTQNVLDAKELGRKMAEEQRKQAQRVRNVRESSEEIKE